MNSSDEEFFASTAVLNLFLRKKERKLTNTSKRKELGEFHLQYGYLRKHPQKFYEYTRMKIETFDYILDKVEFKLTKNWTNFITVPVTACERLIITLRFLTSGASFSSLALSFRVGRSTIGAIVKETCEALVKELYPLHIPHPTKHSFKLIAEQYWKLWQFPNCIGAIDKLKIQNRISINSTILHGVADAKYKFIMIDIMAYDKRSNDGSFSSSQIYQLLRNEQLSLPQNTNLPETNIILPFVFLGDESYPLLERLIRPYSGREITKEQEYFNKRLFRAKECIECAFRIMNKNFKILWKPIETDPAVAEIIVKAISVLHNIIIERQGSDVNIKEEVKNRNKIDKPKVYNKQFLKNGRLLRDQFCNVLWLNKFK